MAEAPLRDEHLDTHTTQITSHFRQPQMIFNSASQPEFNEVQRHKLQRARRRNGRKSKAASHQR